MNRIFCTTRGARPGCPVIGRYLLLTLVVLLALGCGDPNEPATPLNSRARMARATVDGVALAAVSAGHGHTCGLAPDGKAFCWGLNRAGELGIGTDDGPEQCRVGDDIESVVFSCSTDPVPVFGGLFNSLSAGGGRFIGFTCGVGGDDKAYCWGFNRSGQLGIGQTGGFRNLPVPVDPPPDSDSRLDFKLVSAGDNHACGLTTEDVVYCWGDNSAGQLGIDNLDGPEQCVPGHSCSWRPVRVIGGLFNSVSAGGDGGRFGFTCGVGGDAKAYCWGSNFHGMLGTGERDRGSAPLPVPVAPPEGSDIRLDFKSVSAGRFHACGVATDGTAYCWGANWLGQLGNGESGDISYVPVRVEGGLTFISVDAGGVFTCGVTSSQSTVCWGDNSSGQLGIGYSGGQRSLPVPVVHGQFESISVGDSHACGTTATTLEVFCWGDNQFGQLANGTTFPWRDIRVYAIPLADDDGSHAFSVTPQEFADLVGRANRWYRSTAIRFHFDPADWAPMRNTEINRDGPAQRTMGNAIADDLRGKLVCFLRWGADPTWPTGNGNAFPPPGANPKPPSVDDVDQRYVALPSTLGLLNQGNGGFVAHELGHYLGLYHTFPGWSSLPGPIFPVDALPTQAVADQMVVDYIAANGGTIEALDGDLVPDTPLDPTPELYKVHGRQDICVDRAITATGTMNGAPVSFTFTPDPNNAMGYYAGCGPVGSPPPPGFSPEQIKRMHRTLRVETRRHLIAP